MNRVPIAGDKRVRKFFTLWPVSISGEVYWLQTIEVCEWYHRLNWGGLISDGYGWEIEQNVTNHPKLNLIRTYYPCDAATGKGYGYDINYILSAL